MSAVPANGADAFLARYRGLRARLPGDPAVRDAAATAFAQCGLPSVRDEAWKYTSLRALAEAPFEEPLTVVADAPDVALPFDAPRLVMVDGRYQPDLSTPPDRVTVRRFADTPNFGPAPPSHSPPSHAPSSHPMVMLNTMFAEDGVDLEVADGIDGGTVLLLSIGLDNHRPVAFHPRHRVRLGKGAKLTLLDVARGQGTYLHNGVTTIEVADGATLSHIRLQEESQNAFHIQTVFATIEAGATYDAFMLTLGAKLARTEIHARFLGENATAHLNGAQLLGDHQHGDITTVVGHDTPNCASRQTIKNVLTDHARAVFQGRIEVARAAQKTDGYQMNQALLLSPHAEIDSKPQLEIYADDVKCSHGATVGELDPEQLFYLRARGIQDEDARALLVRAFLNEAIDPIAHEGARTLLEGAIETWWERRAA